MRRIIKDFIKLYQSYLWWYLFISVVFLSITFLHQTYVEPIFYALGIFGFIGTFITALNFASFHKKYKKMELLINNMAIGEFQSLKADTVFELFYQEIINKLKEREAEEINKIENASQARDDYFTMWVHQIKTPIAAMDLLIQESGSESSGENFYKNLPMMKQELFKTEQYAEMVLHYLRMEQMEKDLLFQDISLKKIVHVVVKKYSILFIHKKITLELENLESIALTDEKWCEFLIEQVISNAIKYSKDNGKIKIYGTEGGKLIIEDCGIGIKKEDIPRIFERGFTGYNGRMFKKATGLGLYLCKQIADKLSMKIYIESQVTKGTKIILEFPKKELELF